MSCNNIDTCGCGHEHSAKCSFYYGDTLSCIGVVYGTDLEQALVDINDAVCALTPSGSITVIDSCDTNIEVTPVTVGQTTTYTVCLNSDITDDIDTNTASIATLSTCVDTGVFDVTSNDGTITIVETASTGCGRSLDLSVTTPSGTPIVAGIIYNNTDKDGTTGGTGEKTLKNVLLNTYYDLTTLVAGDEIRVVATGQIYPDGINVDKIILELWDDVSTQLYRGVFGGFDKINKQSWKIDTTLTLIDAGSGDTLASGDFLANGVQNNNKSNFTTNSQLFINLDITLVYSSLRIKVIYEHNCTSNATYNFARQLMVEVRKKI